MCARRYDRFSSFVRGREASLRRTYDQLDADGNGRLTGREVEAGLANICFTCPHTRCQYRTRPEARPLLQPTSSFLSAPADMSLGGAGGREGGGTVASGLPRGDAPPPGPSRVL
jgi:hypothetical protein